MYAHKYMPFSSLKEAHNTRLKIRLKVFSWSRFIIPEGLGNVVQGLYTKLVSALTCAKVNIPSKHLLPLWVCHQVRLKGGS